MKDPKRNWSKTYTLQKESQKVKKYQSIPLKITGRRFKLSNFFRTP